MWSAVVPCAYAALSIWICTARSVHVGYRVALALFLVYWLVGASKAWMLFGEGRHVYIPAIALMLLAIGTGFCVVLVSDIERLFLPKHMCVTQTMVVVAHIKEKVI